MRWKKWAGSAGGKVALVFAVMLVMVGMANGWRIENKHTLMGVTTIDTPFTVTTSDYYSLAGIAPSSGSIYAYFHQNGQPWGNHVFAQNGQCKTAADSYLDASIGGHSLWSNASIQSGTASAWAYYNDQQTPPCGYGGDD